MVKLAHALAIPALAFTAAVLGGSRIADFAYRATGRCEQERMVSARLAIHGLRPAIRMVGQFGERYVIYVNDQTKAWHVTRTLLQEMNACTMASGQDFQSMIADMD